MEHKCLCIEAILHVRIYIDCVFGSFEMNVAFRLETLAQCMTLQHAEANTYCHGNGIIEAL